MVRTLSLVVGFLCIAFFLGCEREGPESPVEHQELTAESIEKSFNVVNQFIQREGNSFRFNHAAATEKGLSDQDLVIGQEIAALASDVMSDTEIEYERLQKFESFFLVVAERGSGDESEENLTKTATHCPPFYGMSVLDAKAYLIGNGYHLVSSPWTALPGRDYAKFITTSHWPKSYKPFWTYRAQGIAAADNHSITFQQPEPNPELSAYSWPVYPGTWWGPYVAWWHRYYCN